MTACEGPHTFHDAGRSFPHRFTEGVHILTGYAQEIFTLADLKKRGRQW